MRKVAPPGGADVERGDQDFGGRGFAVGQLGHRPVFAPVLVAEGKPQQQVGSPEDSRLGEGRGSLRPDPGKEADLGVRG